MRRQNSYAGSASRITAATVVGLFGVMPVYFLSAQAPLIRLELGFDKEALVQLVAAFFVTSSLASTHAGRLAERMGARRSALTALAASSATMFLVAVVTRQWLHLLIMVVLAGLANALAHPAASLLLAGAIGKQGLGFGWKQSAVPGATLIAGIALPIVTMTAGWRWAFVGVATLSALSALLIPSSRALALPSVQGGELRIASIEVRAEASTGSLIALSVGAGFAVAAGVSLGSLLVEFAVATGWALGDAGLLLAFTSIAGAGTRLAAGWWADRHERGLLLAVSIMLVVGSSGYIVLGLSASPTLLTIGATIAYSAGWGWNGLLLLAVTRARKSSPGAATGIAQVGLTAGGAAGPLLMGFLLSRMSFGDAWLVMSGLVVIAAVGVFVARSMVRNSMKIDL